MKHPWPLSTELHYYDIYPKVIPAGKVSEITVKPLGAHVAFAPDTTYHLAVCPFDEGTPRNYPKRKNRFEYDVRPGEDGCIRFSFEFFGEQQFYIRLKDDKKLDLELSVYSIFEDLVGRYPFIGDLHIHTNRSDGRQAPAIVCANYRKTGYDFFAITDHRRYYPSLEAIEAYKDVPIEFTIVPGEEIHLPCNHEDGYHINDVHLINFGSEYSINALIEGDHVKEVGGDKGRRSLFGSCPDKIMTSEEYFALIDEHTKGLEIPDNIEPFAYASCHWIFNEIRKGNGLGVFAHPYWVSNVLQVPPEFVEFMMETQPFDAFEVLGGELNYEQNGFQTHQYYEDRIKGRHYPIVGSTDSHSSVNSDKSHICSTIVFSPENERTALIASIKDFYSIAVDTISEEFRLVGEMRFARYACFLLQEFFPLHDDLCYEEGRAMKDYVCGDLGAKELLEAISGRMKTQREKYFAF
ncbi:MAG: hypothetical protein LBS36_00525 [Oscillospiraceae bacterium]|jgi:hypothetical protein|nr:hypothetical protein [Oscillospiraceae bacterium]